MTSHSERRSDARNEVEKPVKIRCLRSGRYLSGKTRNLSAGGALIEISDPHRFVPGQRIKLGVAWNARQTVLDSHALIDSVVIRDFALEGLHQIALRFENRQELAATA